VKAKSEQTFQTRSPATPELLAECAHADEVDIGRAVRAEWRTFKTGHRPALAAIGPGPFI
jgi:hypothetical protein